MDRLRRRLEGAARGDGRARARGSADAWQQPRPGAKGLGERHTP